MPKTSTKSISAEKIAEMADCGQDVSGHFTNQFTVVRPAVQRVNVDFTAPMLQELDREAETLNVSRQASSRRCSGSARSTLPCTTSPSRALARTHGSVSAIYIR